MSTAEDALATQIFWSGLMAGVVREFVFAPPRRFRADFAWPDRKILLEVDGGSWVGGRHTSGTGFEKDAEKASEAAIAGYRVLHVTPAMVNDGRALALVERVLGSAS